MSIIPITPSVSTISFKAGKTCVFADFDSTYTPFSHNDMCGKSVFVNDKNKRDCFNNYFKNFKNLKNAAKDKFSLIITTGRNAAEYIFVENALKEQNLGYFSPDGLVTSNGADIFVRKDGHWIKDEIKNKTVQQKSSGWNGKKIRSDLKKIISQNTTGTLVIESPVNRTKWDYPGISMQDVLEKTNAPNIENYISFNKNEDNIVEIAFANKIPVDNLKPLIKNYLKNQGIHAVFNHYPKDKNAYLPQYDKGVVYYEPGNKMVIKPEVENSPLTKLFDVKEAVKNIVYNDTNDFVIAAGDEINDEEMLNPLNYIDIFGVKIDKNRSVNEILQNKEVLDALDKLPLKLIIVGDSPNLKHLKQMDRILKSKNIDIMTCINSPDDKRDGLSNAIKKAMFRYSERNDEYLYYMGMDLFKYLLSTTNIY